MRSETTMADFSPSPQQKVIYNWMENGTGSAVIEAVAGSGKTTTLVTGIGKTKGSVAFSAFNNAVSKEISSRIENTDYAQRVKVGTVHSFGRTACVKAYPKAKVDGGKLRLIADQIVKQFIYKTFAISAASMAKQSGIGVKGDIYNNRQWLDMIEHHSLMDAIPNYGKLEDGLKWAQELLRVSNLNVSKLIDFDDMIYIPLLNGLGINQYDWVFLDEAQDTNFVRRELVKKMLKPQGRLVAVGDSRQAIYGFTGADCESMDKIRQEFNAISLPLTVTYRCPKKVVEVAQQWVTHIQPADEAPDGEVNTVNLEKLISEANLSSKDAIICRKTKPLVELAFTLIKSGIPCKVEGRSIGKGLISLVKKWKVSTIKGLQDKLEVWSSREMEKAIAKGNMDRCNYVEDQIETLDVLMDHCDGDSVEALIETINSFFGDIEKEGGNILTLSTIHRAKGKEWDHVYALDMDTHSPSKWARKAWELKQEANLCYVQVTRAKKKLTFIVSQSKSDSKGG